MTQDAVILAAQAIRRARYVIVVAGAGMSADSGIPTYRDKGGMWRGHPLLAEAGISSENGVSPRLLKENPDSFWKVMRWKMQLFEAAQPHTGFLLLGTWITAFSLPYIVVTSNIDGMFQKAGYPESCIWEVHGSLHFLQCSKRCHNEVWRNTSPGLAQPGSCPSCGAGARPAVLLFNDIEWATARNDQQLACYRQFCRDNAGAPGVVFEIGVGERVIRLREFASEAARAAGTLVRINPAAVGDDGALAICDTALSGLERVDAALRRRD